MEQSEVERVVDEVTDFVLEAQGSINDIMKSVNTLGCDGLADFQPIFNQALAAFKELDGIWSKAFAIRDAHRAVVAAKDAVDEAKAELARAEAKLDAERKKQGGW